MESRILGRVGTGRVLVLDLHEIASGRLRAICSMCGASSRSKDSIGAGSKPPSWRSAPATSDAYRRTPSDAIHASFAAISPSACPVICSAMRAMSTRGSHTPLSCAEEDSRSSSNCEPRVLGRSSDRASLARARARHGLRPRGGTKSSPERVWVVLRVDGTPPEGRIRRRPLLSLRGMAVQRPLEPPSEVGDGEPQQGEQAAGAGSSRTGQTAHAQMVGTKLTCAMTLWPPSSKTKPETRPQRLLPIPIQSRWGRSSRGS